jgi:hypothetical protein
MKTIIYSIIALSIISFYACSNSSGGGTVVPEEEGGLFPELEGKVWLMHPPDSDPHLKEYWMFSTRPNGLTIHYMNHYLSPQGMKDTLVGSEVYKGSWEGKIFRGNCTPYYTNGIRGAFIQISFVGSTFSGFHVDTTMSWYTKLEGSIL